MKFEVTDSFRADRKRLTRTEKKIIDDAVPAFVRACDRYAADPSTGFPASFRVKAVERAPGVFEMTFNFTGPDLRATFEWVQIEGRLALRWRRLGGHEIFKRP